MNLSYQYDAQTKMFVISDGNRVLDADMDGGAMAIRYGFVNEPVKLGTQPALTIADYQEYASYSYEYIKPPSTPGMKEFLNLEDAFPESKEYCW